MKRHVLLLLPGTVLLIGMSLLWAAPAAGPKLEEDEQLLRGAEVPVDGPELLDFFRKRTLTEDDRKQVQAMIRQLGDDSFQVRQKALTDLVALGNKAAPLLRGA